MEVRRWRWAPVCLDRKRGSLTFDPGPLCGCKRVRVFISPNRFFQRQVWWTDGPCCHCSGCRCAWAGLPAPRPDAGSAAGVFIIHRANGQQSSNGPMRSEEWLQPGDKEGEEWKNVGRLMKEVWSSGRRAGYWTTKSCKVYFSLICQSLTYK